ncbi:hypothetical protein L1887_30169 [Cichorium endivia]|nr:hypothetical protein L1887_30169 [Cichorium endivia]
MVLNIEEVKYAALGASFWAVSAQFQNALAGFPQRQFSLVTPRFSSGSSESPQRFPQDQKTAGCSTVIPATTATPIQSAAAPATGGLIPSTLGISYLALCQEAS